jgi:tetratricopeptide (TPR) repeat protein
MAVEMFAACARRVSPSFEVTPEIAPLVQKLVESVEGLPLAIELAALRMGVLGPKDLLTRWFEEEPGNQLPRDTRVPLQRAFTRSWESIDTIERSTLAQCSVFRGGFTAASAEAVVETDGSRPLLDVLQALRDCSLLRLDQAQESLRLGMHLLVRAFAAAHLSEAESKLVRDRHAAHFLDPERATLEDYDNIMVALSHRRLTQPPDAWLRSLVSVAPVLMARGPVLSFVHELDGALRLAHPLALDDRIAALRARSAAYRAYGDTHNALEDATRARQLASDNQTLAIALVEEASIRVMTSDVEAADRQLQEALGLMEKLSLPEVELQACITLACLRLDCTRTEQAWQLLRQAMTLATRVGDREAWRRGQVLGLMGLAELDVGNLDRAQDLLAQALPCMTGAPARMNAYFAAYAAQVAHEAGDLPSASTGYDRALDTLTSVGDERGESWLLALKGSIAATRDETQRAGEFFEKARDLAQRCTDRQASLVVDLLQGHLDLARARGGEIGAEERARKRITPATDGPAPPASRFLDVRFALRLVTNALHGSFSAAPCLTVAADGSWFRVGNEAAVPLAKHRALCLLLAHLVRLRTTCPGQAVSARALVAVGWPDEKVSLQAGLNRVHVSLTKLRKLGLASVIVRTQSGCLLDPSVRVERADSDRCLPRAKDE